MAQIFDINQLDLNGYYTFKDYMSWQFPERVELYLGRIFRMSPAPSTRHQTISSFLHVAIGSYLVSQPCKVFSAPFDVRLPVSLKKGKMDTVVQPDLCVICDVSKLDEQGCNGAPDLVVEILSPGNAKKEMKDKFELYQRSGVKEYWVVDPVHQYIIQYALTKEGSYTNISTVTTDDYLNSSAIDGMSIAVEGVFEE